MAYNACYSAVSFMVLSSSESSGINFITESGVQCNILHSFLSDKTMSLDQSLMIQCWMNWRALLMENDCLFFLKSRNIIQDSGIV